MGTGQTTGTGPTDIPPGGIGATGQLGQIEKAKMRTNNDIKYTQLVYPIDMDGQSFYPESIKFTVYKRESASLEASAVTVKNQWNELKKQFGSEAIKKIVNDKDGADENNVASNKQKDAMKALNADDFTGNGLKVIQNFISYIENKTLAGFLGTGIKKVFSSLTEGLNLKNIRENLETLDYIYLNMPNEISFAEPVAWEGHDLGMVGAFGKKSANLSTGLLSNFSNIIGGGTGALIGALGGLKYAGGGLLLGMLGGTSMQKGMESSFANIGNPYKEMTFSGIGFREFSFNFVFRARSQTEVKVVQNIIQAFRRYSKPTYANDSSGILNYPEEFYIEFLTKKENEDKFVTNEYIPQMKMCVCKGVTTNFSSQNTWRSLQGGAPVEISLALAFEETELVTAEDVMGATNIGRFAGSQGRF
jgi:hypothetical protein